MRHKREEISVHLIRHTTRQRWVPRGHHQHTLNIDEIPKLSSQEEMNKICNEIFAFTKQIDVNDSIVMHKHENNSEAESKRQNKVMKEEIDIV